LINYFFDEISKEFKKCSQNCNKCLLEKNNCIDCQNNYFKIDGTNICKQKEEAETSYRDIITSTLKQCDTS
jgi:hypothetical protein